MSKFIGLTGKMRAGKDTVYERIVALFPDVAVCRASFADILKVSAMASLGFRTDPLGSQRTDEELVALANSIKDGGKLDISLPDGTFSTITGRQYLQYKGTEGGRDVFGDDFWVDQAFESDNRDANLFVFTDVRFENEARALYEREREVGTVWEVRGVEDETGGHPSEAGVPQSLISLTIDNTVRDDDFAHLDAQLLAAVSRFLHQKG